MYLQINHIYHGFKLTEEEFIEELGSTARHFTHVESGATLIQIDNEDLNKVFTLSFKTPPSNNKGTAHIVEHAICCASKKYPLKDVFIEMDKGSLNTGLNACTYRDMTMYHCASQNEKDFMNLIEVYMDLAFHPLIYTRPHLFRQEGWHYLIENTKDDLQYNGIVYNEMKGEYGEPSTLMEYEIHKALFPDTFYRYDSGGIPEEIVELTEKEFLDFHKKYYHPSHCTFYLYGKSQLLSILQLLDSNTLSHYDKQVITLDIPSQKPFEAPKVVHKKYPCPSYESIQDKAMASLTFVVGSALDTELKLAFQILEHMLLKSAASPLIDSLLGERGLGKILQETGYDTGKKQPTFSITLHGMANLNEVTFKEKVFEVLGTLAYNGIDKDLLEASISTIQFSLTEADSPYEPKGLLYSEDVQSSYLYGGHPFNHLKYKAHLEEIEFLKDKGYFENLLMKYFLDNPHHVLVLMEPDKKLALKEEKLLQKKLKAYKRSLNKQELAELITLNHTLNEFQDIPNTEEELTLLPTLTLSDIEATRPPLILQEEQIDNVKVIFHKEEAHDIVYLHLLFDTTCISQADLPYLGILTHLLTYLSTTHYHYSELENQINRLTGGLNCHLNAYADCSDTDFYRPVFKITSKVFNHKLPHLMDLLFEILTEGLFTEKDKLKEILESIKFEIERSFTSAPEYHISKRLYTYFSATALYDDHVSGMTYYYFIEDLLKHFDAKFYELASQLKVIYTKLIQKNNMLVSITAKAVYFDEITQQLTPFLAQLPYRNYEKQTYNFTPVSLNEAFLTQNGVQTIVTGFNFKKSGYDFTGTLSVISQLLNNTYLWDKVRLQGGAYGCDLTLSGDGHLVICSYCDPKLKETLEIFKGISQYLRELELSQDELTKYIIGTIGGLDYPLTIEQKSEKALTHYLCKVTHDMLQKERYEILHTTVEDIRNFSTLFDALTMENNICVSGSKQKILKCKTLFNHIVSL